MNITIIADQHGWLPDIPVCDLLIVAGDMCPLYNHDLWFQAFWLRTNFREWLEHVPAKRIVGICGNHDLVFERAPNDVPHLPWTYLQNRETEIDGLKIYGSPVTPRFCDWAFNADPPKLEETWRWIPSDTDILITHGPPFGIGDLMPNGERLGCKALIQRIAKLPKLKLHAFGHIHEGVGIYEEGGITFVNSACRITQVDL